MKRTIYHGSPRIVRTPRFGTGSAANDYGLGFYCTESPALAAEWAARSGSGGYVNQYTIETNGLRIINLNSPEHCILHWMSVLLSFREFDAATSEVYQAKEYIRSAFSVDYQNCDCIIGFRADDCNFWFAQSFLNGEISYRQLNDAVRLNDTGRQFVLKSNRAFDRALFGGYAVAWKQDVYPAYCARQREAAQFFEKIRTGSGAYSGRTSAVESDKSRGLYVSDIVSGRIQPYDPRLSY